METTNKKFRVSVWAAIALLAIALPRAVLAQEGAVQDAIDLTPSVLADACIHPRRCTGHHLSAATGGFSGRYAHGAGGRRGRPHRLDRFGVWAVFLPPGLPSTARWRTVQILDVNVTDVKFPQADPVSTPQLAGAVRQAILSQPIVLPLDHLLESLTVMERKTTAAAELQSKPPKITFLDHPAMKVEYDGAPHLMLGPIPRS